jgi:hypothetical protein
MRPATALTDDQISSELSSLETKWKASRSSDEEGHGGSPGEWMVERMDELETEQRRRAAKPKKKYCNDFVPKLGIGVSPSEFSCPYCHRTWERGGAKEGFVKSGANNHVFTCYELLLWRLGYLVGIYVASRNDSVAIPVTDMSTPGRKQALNNLRSSWRKREKDGMLPEIPKAAKGKRP